MTTEPPPADSQPRSAIPATDGSGPSLSVAAHRRPRQAEAPRYVFEVRDFSAYYGDFRAIRDIDLDIRQEPHHRLHRAVGLRQVHPAALLQPHERPRPRRAHQRAGSTTTASTSTTRKVDPVEVRRRIGMVFQKPNPFPKSIYDNVAFGPKIAGYKGDMDELVESSLKRAALWDEVKDKLKQPGTALSGGQQQRLCIARAIAVEPDVILMDEPCSALDPIATLKIEELMFELRDDYTIVIVTHNMQQAARASDETVFLTMGEDRAGYLVEKGPTAEIFTNPKNQLTEDYVSGRFG